MPGEQRKIHSDASAPHPAADTVFGLDVTAHSIAPSSEYVRDLLVHSWPPAACSISSSIKKLKLVMENMMKTK